MTTWAGANRGGKHETVIVAVRHDQGTDQSRRNAPACGPGIFAFAALGLEHDLLGLGEILAQEVARAGLQRFAILHHRFDRKRLDGTGKSFGRCFAADDDRHRHPVFGKVGVDIDHPLGFFDRFFAGGVNGVSFLPQELGGPQKHPRPHFPADDVGPLVDQNRQIAMTLHPLGVRGADDRFAGRANDQRFFQLAGRPQVRRRDRVPADDA